MENAVQHQRLIAILEIDGQLRAAACVHACVARGSRALLEVHGEDARVGPELQRAHRERVGPCVHQGCEPQSVVLLLHAIDVEGWVSVAPQRDVVFQ